MRCVPFLTLSLLLFVAGQAAPVLGAGQQNAKFALHVKATTTKSACTTWAPTNIPCANFIPAARVGVRSFVYFVVGEGDPISGIAGLSCGVTYGSNLNVGWTKCADLEFPSGSWPAPGGGNRITWANQTHCQRGLVPGYEDQGVHAVAGFFTVFAYGPDELSLTQNHNVPTPELTIADCSSTEYGLPASAVGSVRFSAGGGESGTNPCGSPAQPYEPSVLLHINNIVSGDVCRAQPTDPQAVVTAAPADPGGAADYFVMLLGTIVYSQGFAGISGMEFGIDYQPTGPVDGLRVWGWFSCGSLQTPTPEWPADGAGNTISWSTSSCRTDLLVNAGFFSVTAYAPEIMAVSGHPTSGQVALADCAGTDVVFDHTVPAHRLGWVSFGGAASGPDTDGCNPAVESCEQPIPVRPTTWGMLKAKFTGAVEGAASP